MIKEYTSIDNKGKVFINSAEGGTIKAVQLSDNDFVEFFPLPEDKIDIEAAVVPGFYYGNLMMKVAKAINKLVTGG
jgi:hypothetical protein